MNIIKELLKPSVMEIHGPAGSGKTNLCIHIAVILLDKGFEVYFINADKGLSVERIRAVVKQETKMERIKISYVKNTEELEKNIEKVQGALIIDPVTYFYRLDRDTSQLENILKKIREKRTPCIVTNQVYDNIDTGKMTPLARDLLEKYCDIIVELKKKEGFHSLNILKPQKKELLFRIDEKGLEFFTSMPKNKSQKI